jgi:hypothetical protein
MSQIILHRRGQLSQIPSDPNNIREGEVIFASGSIIAYQEGGATTYVSTSLSFIGTKIGPNNAPKYVPLTDVLRGPGLPSIDTATYGTKLDGIIWEDTTSNVLYRIVASNETIATGSHVQLSAQMSGDIFALTGSYYNTTNNVGISGSFAVSGAIDANNITNGFPANPWQTDLAGSFFNNFTPETNTSDILRFIAGLLSASAPDSAPNTKIWGSLSTTATNSTIGSKPAGAVPQSSTNTDIAYLKYKGFASESVQLFYNIGTVYSDLTYTNTYSSIASGATVVSSSVDAQLFGLGTIVNGTTPNTFYVSGGLNWFFSDNSSQTVTATSGSQALITANTFGTTNGLTIGKINTANPAVIPPAYQDGKFANVFSSTLYNNGITGTNISSSGYYHLSSSIRIASGSSAYSPAQTSFTSVFYLPTSINSGLGSNTIAFSSFGFAALTATSRSLSGAPYLQTATWNVSASVSGIASPLYVINGTLASISEADGLVTIAAAGGGAISATTNASGLITSANAVYDSTGTTPRAVSTVPFESDIVKLTGSLSFNAGTSENINQTGLGTTTFAATTTGITRTGATGGTNTQNISYHAAGTFGQPAASGSLAYYGRAQNYDGGTLTGLSEAFSGEAYRIAATNNVLSFTGTAWNTGSGQDGLGAIDLQVKPGFLVKPGGTYKYWLNDPDSGQAYKYYIRRFKTAGITYGQMTLNLGTALVGWDSTSDGVAAAVLFESANSTVYTPARIYDPTKLTDNLIGTFTSGSAGTNPFSSTIAYYGNTEGSLSSTTYTMKIRNADGMFLNSTYDEFYVIVRYKGDPTPISSITVAYS